MYTENRHRSGMLIALLLMIIFVLIGLGAGYFHANTQPKQWKVTANFEVPKVAELGNYYALYGIYDLVQNDGKSTPNLEQIAAEQSYGEFKKALTAADHRYQFMVENPLVKQIAAAYNRPLPEMAREFADKLQFDATKGSLSFTLVNPEQASQILNEFIALQTLQTRNLLNNDLISKWKFLFQNVKQSADANLAESWQAKLKLMQSVEPLDNQLLPYRLSQKPIAAAQPEPPTNLYLLLAVGGGIGLLLGSLVALLFLFQRRR